MARGLIDSAQQDVAPVGKAWLDLHGEKVARAHAKLSSFDQDKQRLDPAGYEAARDELAGAQAAHANAKAAFVRAFGGGQAPARDRVWRKRGR